VNSSDTHQDPSLEVQVMHRLEGGVSWITLNRPSQMNAMTPDQRDRIIALLHQASETIEHRAVVISATGTNFCTGVDLKIGGRTQLPLPEGAPDRPVGSLARNVRWGVQQLIEAVLNCEKPVIAAVNGTAAGIGAHLAFACDVVIAAEEASFIEVFVRRGLFPDGGGTWLLPRLVGLQRAKELIFFGDAVPAKAAERMGLVNKVVGLSQLEDEARAWANRLATGPTFAISLAKAALNRSFDMDRESTYEREAIAVDLLRRSQDSEEGLTSFKENRPAHFNGW